MYFCFSRQYLELLPGKLNYRGPEVLVEFIVSNTNMTTAREHTTRSEIRIVIKLARQVAKNRRKVPKCLPIFFKKTQDLSLHTFLFANFWHFSTIFGTFLQYTYHLSQSFFQSWLLGFLVCEIMSWEQHKIIVCICKYFP